VQCQLAQVKNLKIIHIIQAHCLLLCQSLKHLKINLVQVLEHTSGGKTLKSLSAKHLQSAYHIFTPRKLLPNGAKPTVKDHYIQLLLPKINRRIVAGVPLALPPQPEDGEESAGDNLSSGSDDGDTTRHQPRARRGQEESRSDSE
jgi:hypothetical protein